MAEEFLKKLMRLYQKGFFGPQTHPKFRPPRNARSKEEKLRYYFFALLLDYGVKAEHLFGKLRRLHEFSPEWFNPEFLRGKKEEEIEEKMKELRMRFPKQAAKRWKKAAEKLEEFKDDLLKVFSGPADEILDRLQSFHGFGPKLSRLLLRTVVERGILAEPDGFNEMELPTDVHVAKLAIRSGLVEGEIREYSRIVPEARRKWTELARNLGYVPADVDRALWVLGAEWCSKKRCRNCPLFSLCLKPETS